MEAMSKTKQKLAGATLRTYWHASRQYPRLAARTTLNLVGAFSISIALPFYTSKTIATVFTHNDAFYKPFWGAVAAVTLGILGNRLGFNANMKLIPKVMHDLQARVMDTLLSRGLSFHANNISGKIVSDALDYVTAYNTLYGVFYINGLPLLLSMIFGMVIIFLQSWQLGLYALFVLIITLTAVYFDTRRRSNLRGQRLQATKDLTAHTSDVLVNAPTVKMFAAEKREKMHSQELSAKLRDLRTHDWGIAASSGNWRIGFLLVSLLGLLLVFHSLGQHNLKTLTGGIFTFTYVQMLIMRLFEINTMTRQAEEAFLQAAPMTQIIQESPEVLDDAAAQPLKITAGKVDFSNVSFAYRDNNAEQVVFDNLELSIEPGEHVGLVGPSGGGKSTLTRLLLRFDDITNGAILIDGQDIRRITQTSLRDAVGYVPQEPLLFHRSIRENIAYGRPDATQAQIENAAQEAQAHDFISKLPNGYETVVGERGVKLSGGQRQRVAIARAILKDAPILVLDEATSALDSESEKAIQTALWELMKNKTSLVIAHRLSTIQRLDRILVLDNGQIVEQGSHKELLAAKGLYAKLWAHQSGGFIED